MIVRIVAAIFYDRDDHMETRLMYQSIPILTIPPGDPGDSHVPTAQRVGFSPNFLSLGGGGGRSFELEKFSIVRKEKCRNFSICFKEIEGSLKSRCCCAVSCRLFCLRGQGFALSLCLRGGDSPFQKIPRGNDQAWN